MDLTLVLTVPPAVTSKGTKGDQCAQVHSSGAGTKFCPCDAKEEAEEAEKVALWDSPEYQK